MQSDYSMTIYMFSKCEHLTIIIIEQAVTTIFLSIYLLFVFTCKLNSRKDCIIDPLQLAIHVVQNRHDEEQKSHWDKTNKENYHLKLCMSFVCLVPV